MERKNLPTVLLDKEMKNIANYFGKTVVNDVIDVR